MQRGKASNRARGRGYVMAGGRWVSPYGFSLMDRQSSEGLAHHERRIAKRARKTVEGIKV